MQPERRAHVSRMCLFNVIKVAKMGFAPGNPYGRAPLSLFIMPERPCETGWLHGQLPLASLANLEWP